MHSNSRRGANAIEFALLLPVLIALVAGVLDFGVYFDTRRDVVNAARDGTRAAVAHHVMDEVVEMAEERTRRSLDNQGIVGATVVGRMTGGDGERMLTIEVAAPYHAPIGIIPSPPDYSVSYTMMLEHQ